MTCIKLMFIALSAMVVAVAAMPNDLYGNQPGMPFDFSYAVKDAFTGNDYGHTENSDGKVVKGEYFVLLPDGRKQIVTYTADHVNGFIANVRYEGEAIYPAPLVGKPYA